MTDKKFKFSVIIPIYNVEDYLEETIESVVNQTVGFEDNIELILINDGSPDNSESICKKYEKMYPNNVVYYKQKNAGVSAARNRGIKLAKGEFINFLDSDDKWDPKAFAEMLKAHKKHPEIKVFSCKMKFFDGKKGNHILNYQFVEDKIVDIREDYSYIQLSTCSCVFKAEVLKKHEYNLEIKNEEDTRLMSEILMEINKFMVLSKPVYFYRKRKNVSSASQTSTVSPKWYTVTPKMVYEYLFEESKKKYGKVLDYFKYLIAYDIGWRLSIPCDVDFLTKEEQKEYKDIITKLIKEVDYQLFVEQRGIAPSELLYILKIKENLKPSDLIYIENGDVKFEKLHENNNCLKFVMIDDIYIRDNKLHLVGRINKTLYDTNKVKIKIGNKKYDINTYELKSNFDIISYMGEPISEFIGFKFEYDISIGNSLGFIYDNKEYLNLNFSNQSNLTGLLRGSYYRHKGLLVTYDNGQFNVKKDKLLTRFIRENKNLFGLLIDKKYKQFFIRNFILFGKLIMPRNVWILSDRLNKADDNAEHLFKYLNESTKEKNIYYAISKTSPDYNRMKQYGKVVDTKSLKYKMLYFNAKYIVSSHAEKYITNIFGNNNQYYKDLLQFKYIFLQHGITQADLSPWLNLNSKHIDMFVSAVDMEYKALGTCGYEDAVKLVGFTRYDGLMHKQKNYKKNKTILVSFTWRSALANKINSKTGERLYNEQFKESNYFKWINSFLNNKELIKALKTNGYKIKYIPHPNVIPQLEDFDDNECVQIVRDSIDYQKEFCENSLLITDFSSIYFDFAYLNKPVIYYQPDQEEFYKGQIYDKGYFDYEKIGFGPLYMEEKDLVKGVIQYIENDCKLEDKYQKRINKFFTFNDDKNCERTYKEIINLDK